MSIILGYMAEELERLARMEEACQAKIAKLPRGSMQKRTLNNKEYGYLKYREGAKTVQTYVGPYDSEKVKECIEKIERRKTQEKALRRIKKEQDIILKTLNRHKPDKV